MEVKSTTLWRSDDGNNLINNNESYKMIYNESMLLLNKHDIIGLAIKVTIAVEWTFFIRFISDYHRNPLTSDVVTENNITNFYLNNWYADDWVENNEPFIIESVDKTKSLHVKIRSNASRVSPFRNAIITIWQRL